LAERLHQPQRPLRPVVQGRLEAREEFGRGVGKGARAQRCQRQLLDRVQLAPDGRLDKQDRVPPRQEHRFVG
jgi:hypothetical protein